MDLETLIVCTLIALARVGDVSLGTIRTVFVVQGRRGVAFVLGFCEVLIWVVVVSQVITNLSHPAYAIAYALGFATGNYVGMTVERWVAVGMQVLRVFTRQGQAVAQALREAGFRVTVFDGHGRDGPVYLLFIQTRRRDMGKVVSQAEAIDPECYYVVDDIRVASSTVMRSSTALAMRALMQRK
jgi:uncharacterized protein YebE (UPF0316 family)